jgi:glycosyltransferase involved in cell wall biosynthesis
MNLILIYDHRFYRDINGIVFSIQNHNYSLFARRYLPIFDQVTILARVVDRHSHKRRERFTEGDSVMVIPVGDWHGPFGFLFQRSVVIDRLRANIQPDSAVMMIVPGVLGTMAFADFQKIGRPYGVEVIGDPYDVFGPQASSHPLRSLFRWWFAHNLKQQCAHATAAAYVTNEALQNRYPPNPKAFTTHYSSIELTEEAFIETPPLQHIGAQKDAFTLVHVGTMAQLYKAQDDLIRAVHHCLAQGFNIRLILVGDGKHRVDLEGLVKKLGLSRHVCFCGQLPAGEAVRQQLDQADLFVMPSRTEGLPRAMLEAMARGLPCIGTNMGGIPELLEAENLVPVNDSAALAQKIQEVLLDSERRRRMAQRNWEVATCYRTEVLQVRRESLYTHLKERTFEWMQQRKSEE